jgi:hypothetical protein
MKVSRITVLLTFVLLFSFNALAQNGTFVTVGRGVGAALGPGIPQSSNAVPYSALKEFETIQTLSDGTHITNKTHNRFYRDSAGRTRMELFVDKPDPDASAEPTNVIIYDPVEGVNYFLNPRDHMAVRRQLRPIDPPPAPPKPPINPLPPPPSRSMKLIPLTQAEDLGSDVIEGVWARGSRTTSTIPVNARGNDRPLVTVFETWFSEDLQTDILTKRSDPRNGETTERLSNIDRSAPDPWLFRPPADYTITEPQRSPDVR